MVKKFIYSLMLLGIVFMNNACRDDENIESPFDFNKPCLQWGADMQTVKEYMDGFVLEKETSSELHYVGQDTEKTISYHFIDGNLNTSVIILDEDMVKSNLATTIYKGYINEEDDQQIFIEIKK